MGVEIIRIGLEYLLQDFYGLIDFPLVYLVTGSLLLGHKPLRQKRFSSDKSH